MKPKERVLNCINRKGFDRIPVKHAGEPEVNEMLRKHIGVTTDYELMRKLGDDFYTVQPIYCGPELKEYPDGSKEGIWGEKYKDISFGAGTYCESIYQPFKGLSDPKELGKFRFPSVDWYDFSTIKEQCGKNSDLAIVSGWCDMDLINGTARCRGVEEVLFDIATEDPVYLEIIERRTQFYYDLNKRILEEADGLIDIVHLGEDLGTQQGLLISPAKFDKLFAPKYKRVIDMVHSYGAKVMLHSCGSVRELIPNLIEVGVDILDVVQVTAKGMDIKGLHDDFGDKICFCGSICVQSTLPFGTKEDVRKEVELRKELFADGGLILGPTHAIQVGTPVENILEMYRVAGSLEKGI